METLPVLVQLQEPPHIISAFRDWASLLQGLLQELAVLQAIDMRENSLHRGGWRWRGWGKGWEWSRSLETTRRGW